MIYNNADIRIPILCPIEFQEAEELFFYPNQEKYTPKVRGDEVQPFQIMISYAFYISLDAITLKMYNLAGVVSTFTLAKHTLSVDFYYADCDIHYGMTTDFVKFELYKGTTLLADSVIYERNPSYQMDIKRINYSHNENDFGVVFGGAIFRIDLECGFIPNGFKTMTNKEDFVDQKMNNNIIFGIPYETYLLTIGNNLGIPNWLIRKMNYICILDNVAIDGQPYFVTQGSNIELVEQTENGLGIYSIEMQKDNTYSQFAQTTQSSFRIHNTVFNLIYN